MVIYATCVQQKRVVTGTAITRLPHIQPKAGQLLLNATSQTLGD